MKHKVYISGPMTGLPKFNYPSFRRMERQLVKEGHEVVNPARTGEEDTSHLDSPEWHDYMISAVTRLSGCTAIVMLHGWEDSPGARIERDWAMRMGLSFL